MSAQPIELKRDCEAIQVPYGNTITARQGTTVIVMHQLGDTFTVRTDQGYLIRIAAKDADALGLDAPKPDALNHDHVDPEAVVEEPALWELLKTCYDPEIPANIVDLGLIYTVNVESIPEGGHFVHVEMTLTAPGCGMGQVLKDDVERKLLSYPGVKEVDVELVFQPPWGPEMMTEAARLSLGMM
jgi:probable FeS assembly SUF system protein SufT